MILGIQIPLPVVTLGAIIGMTYGLLAVGLVIVYRVNRVINFAHGATGALAAAVLGFLVVEHGVPYWIAFVLSVAVSIGAGALAEALVIRRLRNAPRIMSLIATLGIAAFLTGLGPVLFSQVGATNIFPQPAGLPSFELGGLLITPAFTAMLVLSPMLVGAFAVFMRKTRFGLALRGSAANPQTARMVGIYAGRMSMLAWGIAGAFAAYTAILVFPARGFVGGEAFGPELLLRALAAAVVARMTSFPVALAAGVTFGVVEQVIVWNSQAPGLPSLLVFAVIIAGLLLQRRGEARTRERGAWSAVEPERGLGVPERFAARAAALRWSTIGALVMGALVLPLVMTNATSLGMATVLSLATVALGIGIVTGLGGHLSLGQFAFAGVGAAVSLKVSLGTGNFALAVLAAGVVGALGAVLVGLPALRIRGIMYAVATLAFAFVTQDFLLRQTWMLGGGEAFERPTIAGVSLATGRSYYYWALGWTLVALLIVRRVRRSGLGRSFVALRDNEDAARASSIPVMLRTVQMFALSGFVAAIGGAVYAHGIQNLDVSAFSVDVSINVAAAAVLGGLGIASGPLLGALYIFAVPQFLPLDSAALAGSALGWLLLIMYVPGGLGSVMLRARDAILMRLAPGSRTAADIDERASLSGHRLSLPPGPARPAGDEVVFEARELAKSFGGVRAVDRVSLSVREGEILGLIGPNGAGKTTLFELLSGFTRPDQGVVLYAGADITALTPERRARLGIVRSFQDSALFPTMTVLDALRLAQERSIPTSFIEGILPSPGADAHRERRARELVDMMGLAPHAEKRISELSTGMRRITEIASVIALQPKVLLLDEPSTGIAQRESEALGDVLRRVRAHLDATMIVIEHDVPLIMGLADRIAAMEAGRIIALGVPDEIAADPRVIESYLGGDPTAIARSHRPAQDRPARTRSTAKRPTPATT